MLRSALLALAILAPLAVALPLAEHRVFVAYQGSRDEWVSPTMGFPCADVIQPVTLTLTVLTGSPDDVVTLVWLDAHGQPGRAEATLGHPARARVEYPTPCDVGYAVEGTRVATLAAYELEAVHG